jgi:hypothetical protein
MFFCVVICNYVIVETSGFANIHPSNLPHCQGFHRLLGCNFAQPNNSILIKEKEKKLMTMGMFVCPIAYCLAKKDGRHFRDWFCLCL